MWIQVSFPDPIVIIVLKTKVMNLGEDAGGVREVRGRNKNDVNTVLM